MDNEELLRRTPPHSLEAEMACIGAIFQSNIAVDALLNILREDDFYDQKNRLIFNAVKELSDQHAPIDTVSVANILDSQNQLQRIGGSKYLLDIVQMVPATSSTEFYAKIVLEKSLLRQMIQASLEIIDNVYANQNDFEEVADRAERAIFDLTSRIHGSNYILLKDAIKLTLEGIQRLAENEGILPGVQTNFPDLDALTGGLQRGNLIIIAARPAMGKTSFALNLAVNVAKESPENGILFFSLEMTYQEIVMRLLASESEIKHKTISRGDIRNNTQLWDRLIDAAGDLSKLNIIIDESDGLTINEIRSRARNMKRKYKINMIMIDHLQLVNASHNSQPSYNRNQEISFISRSLKGLAKELDIPVVVLSQLSRAVESRTDKHPILADLRESGAIEQDADLVAFLYRDVYYNKDTESPNVTELKIEKNRHGALGTINLFFNPEITRFESLDSHHTQLGSGFVPGSDDTGF